MRRTELKTKGCGLHRWVPSWPSLGTKSPIEKCVNCDTTRPYREPKKAGAGKLSSPSQKKSTTATLKRGRGFQASPAQQKKAREEPCVVTGQETLYGAVVDPAHLWPRSRGGCDDPLCVVPLLRHPYHRDFDEGKFDLLPYLVRKRVPELCHALEHAEGDVEGLLRRLAPSCYRQERAA